MLAGPDSSWLDPISKASPVLQVLGIAAMYLIGTHTRAKVNDKELLAVTKAVETLERIITDLVEQKFRTQEHIAGLVGKINDICREIKELRDKIEHNTGDLRELRARVDYPKRRTE